MVNFIVNVWKVLFTAVDFCFKVFLIDFEVVDILVDGADFIIDFFLYPISDNEENHNKFKKRHQEYAEGVKLVEP